MSSYTQMCSRGRAPSPPESLATEVRISPDLQDHLGQQLRAMYDGLRTEPVPERILDLLKRLDVIEPGHNP